MQYLQASNAQIKHSKILKISDATEMQAIHILLLLVQIELSTNLEIFEKVYKIGSSSTTIIIGNHRFAK